MKFRQSTAVDVLIGPFVDSTDGYTPEVGVSPAVKLSKAGQALAAKTDITTPVHDADGYYNCELDATDTNTVGTLVLTIAGDATALGVRHEFQVVEEAVYDALYASGAAGPLEADNTGSGLTAVPWNASWDAEVQSECADALTAYDPPTNTEMVAAFTEIKGAGWASPADTLETIKDQTALNASGIVALGATLGTNGDGLSAIPWNASWDAEVQSECADALTAYDPPTNTEMVAALTEIKGATWASGTDTLEAIRDRGDAAWVTGAGGSAPTVGEIADAVWDEATAGHTGGGTFGEQCKIDIDAILADTNELQSDDVPTLIAALNDLAAADVNAEVVDVLKTDTIADRSAGLPPATPTFEQAIAYLYGSMRNSIDVDSGFKEFYNNAGALIWKKALSDDGSNYVEAKSVAP